MFIEAHCSVPGCRLPMVMPGAVVISPPVDNESGDMIVTKYHICALCWATKFKKLLDDGEFENMSPQPPDTFRIADVERADGHPVVVWEKDPVIAEMDPEIDVMKILGKALWNKVEQDMTEYFAGLEDNRLVPNYCVADVELMDVMLEHDRFWSDRKKKHPIWDLLKRGWL